MLETIMFDRFEVQGIYHVTVSPDWSVVLPGDMWDHEETIGQMGQGETGRRRDKWDGEVTT